MFTRIWQVCLGLTVLLLAVVVTGHAPSEDVGNEVFTILVLDVLVIGAAYIAVRVWPTAYRYMEDGAHIVRVHRRSGVAEILTPTGWLRLTDADAHSPLR